MDMQKIIRQRLSKTGLKGIKKRNRKKLQWKLECESYSVSTISEYIQEKIPDIPLEFLYSGHYLYIIYTPKK